VGWSVTPLVGPRFLDLVVASPRKSEGMDHRQGLCWMFYSSSWDPDGSEACSHSRGSWSVTAAVIPITRALPTLSRPQRELLAAIGLKGEVSLDRKDFRIATRLARMGLVMHIRFGYGPRGEHLVYLTRVRITRRGKQVLRFLADGPRPTCLAPGPPSQPPGRSPGRTSWRPG